ncbi:hypothetical protein EVAR_61247_1 [Eumeta japonica]|uniref:Uncharacterized protein n=1 Tax=Eumeta variegata TaxID=151549 RepID=A0A4C1Z247_EUMVA|nr:hypothetical protein EVAR_61247_1 [Eumeta japonica]
MWPSRARLRQRQRPWWPASESTVTGISDGVQPRYLQLDCNTKICRLDGDLNTDVKFHLANESSGGALRPHRPASPIVSCPIPS